MKRLISKENKHPIVDLDLVEELGNRDEANDVMLDNVFKKLGKLEDLEEQIGMPLDIFMSIIINQQEIYSIIFDDEIEDMTVDRVLCNSHDDIRLQDSDLDDCGVSTKEYGKSWFLTREEAEKKLEEMKNGI